MSSMPLWGNITMTISDKHLEKIRHACKLNQKISVYRNYFVTTADSSDDLLWQDLVREGYATFGLIHENMHVYFATEEGIRAAIPIIIKD